MCNLAVVYTLVETKWHLQRSGKIAINTNDTNLVEPDVAVFKPPPPQKKS